MNKFWVGYAVACFLRSMIQDLIGKDEYLKTVAASWVNTKWWYWPLAILGVVLVVQGTKWMERWADKQDAKLRSTERKIIADIDAILKELEVGEALDGKFDKSLIEVEAKVRRYEKGAGAIDIGLR